MHKTLHSSSFASIQFGSLLRFAFVIITGLASFAFNPVSAQGRLQVKIDPNATLLNGGQSAQISVTVECSPGNAEILEAFIYISQDGIQSNYTPIPVECRGGRNTYQVTVTANEGETFKSGEAHSSAYILIMHPKTGKTTSGQASGTITLQ